MEMDVQRGYGRFQATRESFGFVVPEDGGQEVFVPAAETGGAFHRDRVEFEITRPADGRWKAEAVVLRVLERGFRTLTGVVAGTRKRPHLVPDHPLLPARFRLLGKLGEIEAGQRVLCELHDVGGRVQPGALLLRILGDADDARLDTAIVEAEFALPGPHPPEVVAEARARREALAAAGPGERADFSAEQVFTIDPVDARDFDDAVSLHRDPRGFWLLRVHIADVAEAVPVGGVLDAEARRRGNSSYLPGKVIPMLPEILSTDLMSLTPGIPKRVLSVSARIGREGEVLATRIDEAWIVSRHRLDYDRVQQVLEGRASIAPAVDAVLSQMDELARQLRARRFARGGFDLEVPEVEITLDAQGLPSEIRRRTQARSHQIIEEFMILANRIACSYARRRGHPYLHRVHRPPDPIAVAQFCEDVRTLAPEVSARELQDLPALRRWLAGLPREPRTWRIHGLFLRSLQRAVYSHSDSGHFGLGLRGYGHFTSPIRRYPDLFNHRVIKWALRHGRRAVPRQWRDESIEVAVACSETEERSERAERELVRIKCLRWAEQRLGSSFRGTLVAVLPRGFMVELDIVPVTGFVPRSEAGAARPHEQGRSQVGPGRGGLQVGSPVIVQIARVDRRERRLLFFIRAAGDRARELDPEGIEPLVDPAEQITEARRGKRRGSRRSGKARAPRRKGSRSTGRRLRPAGRRR
jgi:ribonuclease R